MIAVESAAWPKAAARYLSIFLLVCLIYWACLTYAFPGYFAPFVPHHSDMYAPAGLLTRSVGDVAQFPRPVTHLFLRGIGIFGVEGSIAAVVILVAAGVALIIGVIPGASFAGATLFCLLLFAHPQFYFQHRHDVPPALSLLFLVALVGFAQRWLRGGGRLHLAGALLSILALGLTKETYYVSAFILVGGLLLLDDRLNRRRWLGLLAAIGALEVTCLVYNSLRYKQYLGDAIGSAYSLGFHPLVLLPTLWTYVRELAALPAAALVLFSLYAIRSDSRRFKTALLLIVAGIASLLPNAALPNHIEAHYAWVAAPLFFAPVLLAPPVGARSAVVWMILAALTGACLWSNRDRYASEPQQWLVSQEQGNARILSALPAIRREAGNSNVVAGLKLSYHPWLSSDFVKHYFGASRRWTFLVPFDGTRGDDGIVRMIDAAHAGAVSPDCAVLFRPDGNVESILRNPPLSDELLAPALGPPLARLRNNPDDFYGLLGVGVEYLQAGWMEKAALHLNRAVLVDRANPYPYFFLGRLAEATGDRVKARPYYREAIARDSVPPNLAFRAALANVSSSAAK